MMSIPFKQVLMAALFSLPLFSVAHATVVTMRSSGTIAEGWDYPGLFTWGEDLAGQSFELSLTVDTATLDPMTGVSFNGVGGVSQLNSVVYGKTTVGGEVYNWRLDGQEAHVALSSMQASMSMQGTNSLNGNFTGGLINTFSQTGAFLDNVDFAKNRNLSGLPGVRTFVMFMNNQLDGNQTYFDGFADNTTWEVSAVPEPDSVAMLAAGIGMVMFAARRRSRVNAGVAGAPRFD